MAHILIVDDDPIVRETLSKILSLNGHTIVCASSVAEALGVITSARFDLLISDLNVGEPEDGFLVVNAMRRIHPDCLNFILTGFPGFETALKAISDQVDAYLVKPANVPQLLQTIKERLMGPKPRELKAKRRLSAILRENVPVIIERVLAALKQDQWWGALGLTDGQLIEGLPDALTELANALDLGPEDDKERGESQSHPLRLLVQKRRIIGQVVRNVLYENLLTLELDTFLRDMAQLNDMLLWQLAHLIHGYIEERPPEPLALRERGSEQQLMQGSAEQLQSIIDSAMDAIISVDSQQNITLFNHSAERLFGWSAVEVIGKPLDRLLPEGVRGVHRSHVERFGATGVTRRSIRSLVTVSALRRDGKEFPIEATISQVGEGEQKRYTVILRDITQRKQTERALVQSEKLAVIGRLSASLAHEINNPLEGLKNLLYVITQDPSDTETVRRYARMADTEVSRIATITKQVLGLSRGGIMRTLFRPIEVVDAVLVLVQRRVEEKGASVTKEYRSEGEVWGVASEIHQVVWNLLANCIDAIPRGGSIRVRVAGYHRPRDGRTGVRITIADNGGGIATEHLPHLFEPFYTTKSYGNGLGLWVADQIIDQHDGSIRIKSRTQGRRTGTVFSIFLPTKEPLAMGLRYAS